MKKLLIKIKICIAILTGKQAIVCIDFPRKKEYELYLMDATIWHCMKTASLLQDYSQSKIMEQ